MKLFFCFVAIIFSSLARAEESLDIIKIGQELDNRFFAAYNTCDLKTFGNLLDPSVEFYHDKSGLMTGRENVVAAIKNNICGKFQRKLVPGSLQSFAMDNYGFMQLGEHIFCEAGTNQCAEVARFVHLWQRKDGVWHITRIISYAHQSL